MVHSERTERLTPSATMAALEKIQALIRSGENAISFGAGEPDFGTPEHISEAAIKAIRDGYVGSLPTAGLPELREAIAEYLCEKKGLNFKPSEIIISNGSKQAIMNAILTLVNKGDEVLIPAPAWVSFFEQVKLADAIPVIIPTSERDGFKVKSDMIKSFITKKTKLLILNNPNNPTGSLIDRENLMKIAELMVSKQIHVISDEIYERLVYDGKNHCSIASLFPEIQGLSVTTNGFSKTYAMPGWRVGYAAANEEIIRRMVAVQSHYTSGSNHVAQRAAVAALKGSQECVETMKQSYRERRDLLLKKFQTIPEFSVSKPEGAFYVFPNVQRLFRQVTGRQIDSSVDLSTLFLDRIQVGVVPGSAFGVEGYVRISYACDIKKIDEGMDRIATLLRAD